MFLLACNAQKSFKLSPSEFDKGIKDNSIQLLDVRTKGEYAQGHISNALQADWNNDAEFEKRTLALNASKAVYIYCLSGGRSSAAATNLRAKGFTVYELTGGINAWKNEHLAVEGATNVVTGITLAAFNNVIATNDNVLVDFGAKWCPPCIKMNSLLDSLVKKYPSIKLLKIDLDSDKEICSQFNITEIPVFHAYQKSIKINEGKGLLTFDELKKLFNL
jgi:rhodanese-related sulfurtransferase